MKAAPAHPPSIQVEYRKVYGKVLIYPANMNADWLAQIAGTKTLSEQDLELAAKLGLEVLKRDEHLAVAA